MQIPPAFVPTGWHAAGSIMSYNQKIVFCGINGLSEGCFVSNDFFVSFDLVPYPRLNDGYIHFRLKLKKVGLYIKNEDYNDLTLKKTCCSVSRESS